MPCLGWAGGLEVAMATLGDGRRMVRMLPWRYLMAGRGSWKERRSVH